METQNYGIPWPTRLKHTKPETKTDTYTFNGASQIKSFAKLVAIVVVVVIFIVGVAVTAAAVDVFVTLVNLN